MSLTSESRKYAPFIVRAMPGQEMTAGELERQIEFVSSFRDAFEAVSERDEVEALNHRMPVLRREER